MLVVISGLPGTGKSAVAQSVATRTGAVQLSVDVVEDALLEAGLPPGWTTGVAAYEAVRAAAEQNLALGRIVVVDAVNDSEPARNTWRRAARATGTQVRFVVLSPPDAHEHRARLEGRQRALRRVQEPTWEQVETRAASYAPWTDEHLLVDGAQSLQDVVDEVVAALDSAVTDRGLPYGRRGL